MIVVSHAVFVVPLISQLVRLLNFNSFGPYKIRYSFGSPFSRRSVGLAQIFKLVSVVIHLFLYLVLRTSISESIASFRATGVAIQITVQAFLVFPLHVIESTRSVVGSDVLIAYWLTSSISSSVILAQDVLSNYKVYASADKTTDQALIFTLEVIFILNSISILLLESKFYNPAIELAEYFQLNDWDIKSARNLLDRYSFVYLNGLLSKIRKSNNVSTGDLPAKAVDVQNKVAYDIFLKHWNTSVWKAQQKTQRLRLKSKNRKTVRPSLTIPMIQSTKALLVKALIADIFELAGNLGQPYLLRAFLQFINERIQDESPNPPLIYGFVLAISLYLLSVVKYVAYNRYVMSSKTVSYCIESFLSSHVYHKALKLSPEAKKHKSSGEIVNNLAQDVEELTDSPEILMLLTQPIRIAFYAFALYSFLGPASLAGFAVCSLFIPAVYIFFMRYVDEFELSFKFKDERAKLMSEILHSIKSIKLYSWEKPMFNRLNDIRNNKELIAVRNMGIWNSLIDFVWSSMPFFISCTSFAATALFSDTILTPDIVFPALALFGYLTEPLLQLPDVFARVASCKINVDRLTEYFALGEFENPFYDYKPDGMELNQTAITVKGATFVWSNEEPTSHGSSDEENTIESRDNRIALSEISFTAKQGELTCVVGKVGSGKTTLLRALIGDVDVDKNSEPLIFQVRGETAYCSQEAWIMNSSLKENILFGKKYDKSFYEATVDACELAKDFKFLPDGDMTIVGEKGITLSGGQKARVSLARAVYSRADIYILDDILSAVDAHVGHRITEKVLSKTGLLSSKTIVLATNFIPILHEADQIVLLESGRITENNSYQAAMNSDGHLANLIKEFGKRQPTEVKHSEDINTALNMDQAVDDGVQTFGPDISDLASKIVTSHAASFVPTDHSHDPIEDDIYTSARRTAIAEEIITKGKVKMSVYLEFFKACGITYIILYFILQVISIALRVLNNYILKYWSELNADTNSNNDIAFFLLSYAGVGLIGSCLTLIGAFLVWVNCSINAGKYFHDKMAKAVLGSPMSFFDTTPAGRILNRFTDDIGILDEHMTWIFISFCFIVLDGISVFIVVVVNLPFMLLVIAVLAVFYDSYRRDFVPASREFKRLRSSKKSPVLSHLQESIAGIETLKAFGQLGRFININRNQLDDVSLVQYNNLGINCWLSMRLQGLSSMAIFSSSIIILLTSNSSIFLSPGTVGFVMTYILEVTFVLNSIVKDYADIETRAVTIERLSEYCNLRQEAAFIVEDNYPPANWPQEGRIEFQNYSAKYRDNLDLILSDLTFTIEPSQKIGVVGRTGAGKSTLTLGLFRILEAYSGRIIIDGVDISKIGLHSLRSKLNIIPQDSHLIEGTMRQNLDTLGTHSDEELWKVLQLSHLKEHVEKMKTKAKIGEDEEDEELSVQIQEGLDAVVSEGGANLSAGQKQLICLARALLNPSRILVLDEATASVDTETDKIVQETIRGEFKDKTIITIAHRIETILDSDKILVLDEGKVKEYAPPR